MADRISITRVSKILKKLLSERTIIDSGDTSFVVYDFESIEKRINKLKSLFPENSLHAIAIKANPLLSNLKLIKKIGTGAEAASLPEVHLALKAGFAPSKIVFDSPAKTKKELSFVLKEGININADSFEELKIIEDLLAKAKTRSKIGVRINPQTGVGSIAETSVAGKYSKFGIPIKDYRKTLQTLFLEKDWLRGVHLHIGSQGISLEMLLKGIKTVYDFIIETNNLLKKNSKKPIGIFDIGGGLPVSYYPGKKSVTIKEYYSALKKNCPELFSGEFKLITEFGRNIYANSAFAVSRVEYVKRTKKINTAIIHLGADMFIRKAYMPKKWHHEISVLDKNGKIKTGKKFKYVIAGPLCFAGDMIEKNIMLPEIEKDDFIVIQDVGAYTISMWSRYNSRQMPKVLGFDLKKNKFKLIKDRESIEKVIDFWS